MLLSNNVLLFNGLVINEIMLPLLRLILFSEVLVPKTEFNHKHSVKILLA